MGAPTSLLGTSRAFARDFARDQMPQGYLWDVVDFVPQVIDAMLTGRGGWTWGSDFGTADIETGILASYLSGDQLLVQNSGGQLLQIDQTTGVSTVRTGAVPRAVQNPIQLFETVIHFDGNSTAVPSLISDTAITSMHASAPHARVGAIWRNYVASDGGPGLENRVRFGVPGLPAAAYDDASKMDTAAQVTGLAGLRSVLLVFHPGSTERIRGTLVPTLAGNEEGDLTLEPLFGRVGCNDPKTIAYWGENVIFADQHGVHMTDGAVVRNLANQGGIGSYWRQLWAARFSVTAAVFLDYYIITIVRDAIRPPVPLGLADVESEDDAVDGPTAEPYGRPPVPPVPPLTNSTTLICDLTRRQWFRFSNIGALGYFAAAGASGTERLWTGITNSNRLARIHPCFFPDPLATTNVADADGTVVRPVFETPWYRLSHEGRKRIRFAYLSYDARAAAPTDRLLTMSYIRSPQQAFYTNMGSVPSTTDYRRFRLPVGQVPYGMAFKVEAGNPFTQLRIFDLATEATPLEQSRV